MTVCVPCGYIERVDVEGDDLEQLISGRARVIGVKIFDKDKLIITLEVNGRTISVRGFPEIGSALKVVRPWEEPGWLEAQLREYGSLRAVARAYELTDRALKLMYAYAHGELGWRIQEGTELKRWTFLERYFASAMPSARPTALAVAEPLGVAQGIASRWVSEALKGKFFSSRFSPEKLAAIQSHERLGSAHVYFPGSDRSLAEFSLAREDGWPTLPAGLLNDLLPKLSSWETRSVIHEETALRVSLRHQGHVLDFEIEVSAQEGDPVSEAAELISIKASERGLLRFVFGDANVVGRVSKVYEASAGRPYDVGG